MPRALINNFSGGLVTDPRDTSGGVSRVTTNFDTTNIRRLIPYRSSESADSSASTSQKQNFLIAHWLPGSTNDYRLFSLGVVSGSGKAEILMKTLTTGGSTDLSDATWATPSNNAAASLGTEFDLFLYYKKTGLIYGAHGGSAIWAFNPATAGAFADSSQALTYSVGKMRQGIIHSQDDVMYVPYYTTAGAAGAKSFIASNNNGTWDNFALTLPDQYIINSICEYGANIAIAAAPISGVGNSRVFIWDRDSSLATIDESIDWGYGIIKIIEEIDGFLVGISLNGGTSTTFKDRIQFKYFTGAGAKDFFELVGTTSSVLLLGKQKINNRIHFMMTITLNGAVREGVWSFGKNSLGNFTLVHERTPNNDTAVGSGALKNFFYVGDFLFQSSTLTSGAFVLLKTDDTAAYSATSIYESVINPGMAEGDKMLKKQLKTIAVTYTTLSSVAGQLVVKVKVDGATSYTTVGTATTTGVNVVEYTKDSSGNEFTAGREYEFRTESTLGLEISAITYTYNLLETLIQ